MKDRAGRAVAHIGRDIGVGLRLRSRPELAAQDAAQRLGREDPSRQADAGDELRQVCRVAEIARIDQGLVQRIRRGQRDPSSTGRAVDVKGEADAVAVRLKRLEGRFGEAIRQEERL